MPERPAPSTKPLLQKIGVKPGYKVLIANAPADVAGSVAPPHAVTVQASGAGPFDAVLFFVHNRADVESKPPRAVAAVKPGGLLWIAYPKRASGVDTDISCDVGWEPIRALGWEVVSLVAGDERWSAVRFRKLTDIPKLSPRRGIGRGQ